MYLYAVMVFTLLLLLSCSPVSSRHSLSTATTQDAFTNF